MKSSRRQFIIYSTAGLASLSMTNQASAQAMVAETDPQAVGLGYIVDVSKVDKAKFPKYAAGNNCANCQLYMSKSAEAGSCGIFPGKMVAAQAWCNAWVKKAG